MVNTRDGAGHPPLDPSVADKLLELLSTDDDFRELFVTDSTSALAKVGYSEPENATIECTSVTSLAPKEEIAAAHEQLKKYMTSQLALHDPHCFEAGKIDPTLRRK